MNCPNCGLPLSVAVERKLRCKTCGKPLSEMGIDYNGGSVEY
jgi:predicted amidophosphoribosyltransferase